MLFTGRSRERQNGTVTRGFFQIFDGTVGGVADCSAVNAFLTGDIRVFPSFKIDLTDEVLLPRRKLVDGGIQPAVFVFGSDLRLNIVI